MIICPTCKHENLPGTLYCDECAELLQRPVNIPPEEEKKFLDTLSGDTAYGLVNTESGLWMLIQPETFYKHREHLVKGRLLLGRLESTPEYTSLKLDVPNIDRFGISRLHAALIPLEHGVGLQDVGSTNGTRLNGQKLAKGRTYNLQHQDRVDLGKLSIQVHFVKHTAYLNSIRDTLVKQFTPEIQTILGDMEVPAEALHVLLERLPGKTQTQMQVLTLFKERKETITLERLHQRINRAMSDPSKPLRPQDLDGEDTQAFDENALKALEPRTKVFEGQATSNDDGTGPVSALTEALLTRIYNDGIKLESRLRMYLEEAERLPTDLERQEVINFITPILIQMNTWLPTLAPLTKADTKSLKPLD